MWLKYLMLLFRIKKDDCDFDRFFIFLERKFEWFGYVRELSSGILFVRKSGFSEVRFSCI